MRALEAQGTGVMQIHPEYSTGQFELSVPHGKGIEAADTHIVARQTIRSVARTTGLDVSFAPVAFAGLVGNGCHLHFSIWDGQGRNLFAGGRGPEGMRAVAESFTAGVLEQLPAIVAVSCPSVASYQRLQPHRWAGAYAAWGPENREAGMRFVGGMKGRAAREANMEIKAVDGSSNPYMALGSVVAAGIDGIDRGAKLPSPTTDDPSTISASRLRKLGMSRLPASLGEAIKALERSSVLSEAMGSMLFDAFVASRRAEWEKYGTIGDEAVVAAYRWRF
jgi:glutamine synthetase